MRIFFDELLIGFDFTNFLISIFVITVIYLAWQSTEVREERLVPTAVLIIENNRRRHRSFFRDIRTRAPDVVDNSTETQPTFPPAVVEIVNPPPTLESVIEEVNGLATAHAQENTQSTYRALESLEGEINEIFNDTDSGPQRIIRDMDSVDTAEGLRRRRLAFYAQDGGAAQNVGEGSSLRDSNSRAGGDTTDNSAHAENCSNENNENENISKSESIKSPTVGQTLPVESETPVSDKEEFRIKLKYLNDDTRMVTGSPSEVIGDFKKRNFTVELAAEKLVRLVFNGHVLQPDSKTLQACGLFDNCVVHCLVHNKKPQHTMNSDGDSRQPLEQQNRTEETPANNAGIGSSSTGTAPNAFLNRGSNGPLFVYLGLVAVTLTIIFCWFCRFQYSYLFSLYSTISLILMTVLFLIMLPLIVMIEREVD